MNNLTDKLSLKNNKPMKPFNRNFLTTSSKIFEKQTMLSQSVISSDIIVLDSVTKSLLQQSRVKYQRQIIKFKNSKTNAKFLTSKKFSFEALIIEQSCFTFTEINLELNSRMSFIWTLRKEMLLLLKKKHSQQLVLLMKSCKQRCLNDTC